VHLGAFESRAEADLVDAISALRHDRPSFSIVADTG